MHILHIFKNYHPIVGGIESHLRLLAEGQAAAGHKVEVLTCRPAGQPKKERVRGVSIQRCKTLFTAASTPVALPIPGYLFSSRADIIHFHTPYPWADACSLFLQGRRTVLTHHSDIIRQQKTLRLYAPVLRRILRGAGRILCTSHRYMNGSPWLTLVRDKCRVVPLGVDTERFHPANLPPHSDFRILFLGKLRAYKGIDVLFRALLECPQVQLLVAGEEVSRTPFPSAAVQLQAQGRVQFLGIVPEQELPALYRSVDLLVLPSINRSEAFGLVLLEAMACGIPCLTTELGTGTSWVVEDGVTGVVVKAGDPRALSHGIRTLQQNPELRRQMGRRSRQRVLDRFRQEQMVSGVFEVYQKLIPALRSLPSD